MEEWIMHGFDLFGTVVFAITGAVRGMRRRFDLLGVIVLSCTVGVGGGIVRDVIIGSTPVAALTNETYLVVCTATGLGVFYLAPRIVPRWRIVTFGDAIGLGVFTALGAAKGDACGLHLIGVVLCGVFTAVAGGVIRDLMTRNVPVVLTSDFYATAALFGGLLYYGLARTALPFFATFLIVSLFVTGIRLLAIHFKIRLPVAAPPPEPER